MGWRDFRNPTLVEKMEKMGKIPADAEQIPFIPFIPLIPPIGDSNFTGSLSPERLTDAEQEAYQEYIEIMVSPKFNLPMEQAEQEAMQLVMRAKRSLQARQAATDYKRDGYVKIYSTVLSRAVYMAKNKQAAKQVPDKSLPVFLESEIRACNGLDREEAKILLEAKIIFEGTIG